MRKLLFLFGLLFAVLSVPHLGDAQVATEPGASISMSADVFKPTRTDTIVNYGGAENWIGATSPDTAVRTVVMAAAVARPGQGDVPLDIYIEGRNRYSTDSISCRLVSFSNTGATLNQWLELNDTKGAATLHFYVSATSNYPWAYFRVECTLTRSAYLYGIAVEERD